MTDTPVDRENVMQTWEAIHDAALTRHEDGGAELARLVIDADDVFAALTAERDALKAERDEALRRRDAWKERAAVHVEIVNALKAKTRGQDSRTLSKALLGAACAQCEAERDRLVAVLTEMRDNTVWLRHVSHFRRRAAVTLAKLEKEKADD